MKKNCFRFIWNVQVIPCYIPLICIRIKVSLINPTLCWCQLKHVKHTCVIRPYTVIVSQKIRLYYKRRVSVKGKRYIVGEAAVATEPNPDVCLSVHTRIPGIAFMRQVAQV